jgi:hypothetical protein
MAKRKARKSGSENSEPKQRTEQHAVLVEQLRKLKSPERLRAELEELARQATDHQLIRELREKLKRLTGYERVVSTGTTRPMTKPKRKGGHPRNLSDEQIELGIQYLRGHPELKLKQALPKVNALLGASISESTFRRRIWSKR